MTNKVINKILVGSNKHIYIKMKAQNNRCCSGCAFTFTDSCAQKRYKLFHETKYNKYYNCKDKEGNHCIFVDITKGM